MIAVSNADRIVFPAVQRTKGDVVAYYQRMAPRILPHVTERPLSIRRFPKGLSAPGFFQKNVPPHYPASIRRLEIPRNKGQTTLYPVLSELEHLPYLANQGALELHVPTGRAPELRFPDRVVIDLDPPSDSFELVRRAAHLAHEVLTAFGLPAVPVATGSKGYHLVSAIQPSMDVEEVALALQKVGALLAAGHPHVFTIAFRIKNRAGRVFVDSMRNYPAATVVAPYSLRARPKASVATPLSWAELDSVAPDAFTIDDVDRLLERPDTLAELAPADPEPFVRAVDAAFAESGLVLEPFDRFRS
jgi:bifunctional non-homologous end joining protein LigD